MRRIATLTVGAALLMPVAPAWGETAGGMAPLDTSNGGASPIDPGLQPGRERKARRKAVKPVRQGPPGTITAGRASAPAGAPPRVVAAIAAANAIASKPYRLGGGHGEWEDDAYDCSGAVSYALHGGGLLDSPLASGGLMSWGERGAGRWITIYSNPDHVFVVIAGMRFDTGWRDATSENSGTGPRWGVPRPVTGYRVRHFVGL